MLHKKFAENKYSRMSFLLLSTFLFTFLSSSLASNENFQDACPASTAAKEAFFINGFSCKNASNIIASDFKSTKLTQPGNTNNGQRSAVLILTAAEFPGLNTLGLAVARTDIEVNGFVMPHSHPRASEIMFVHTGSLMAGFVDTNDKLFQKLLLPGDVFIFPKGLIHYCANFGYEPVTVFSVHNSQNPGVVRIAGFILDLNKLKEEGLQRFDNATMAGFTGLQMHA